MTRALPDGLEVEGLPHLPGRRETPTVDVGGVPVGSRHPVVVQSMTNTDTADADATALQVAALAHAGSELVRVTVNTDAAAAAVPEMVRKIRDLGIGVPGRRRLPLQRPSAPGRSPGHGRCARQVPHQSGQRRGQATRRALPDHRPGRHRARQAGPHRRQLGLARPGPADRDDGRQCARSRAPRRARRDDRGHDRVGAALGGSWRRPRAWATTASS